MIRTPPEVVTAQGGVPKFPSVQVSEINTDSSSDQSGSRRGSQIDTGIITEAQILAKEETSVPRAEVHTKALFDEKHNAQLTDPDVTIDTVLEGDISFAAFEERKPKLYSSSKPANIATHGQSSGPSTNGINGTITRTAAVPDTASPSTARAGANGLTSVQVPKQRRIRIASSSSMMLSRRTLSTETTVHTNSAVDRRISGLSVLSSSPGTHAAVPRTLPIEERLVKAHSYLRDLQYSCSLSVSEERTTIQRVFDLIDKIRMRQVPRQWSPLDRRLKQVQSSAERIAGFAALVSDHGGSDADGVASMFFTCCEVTLQGDAILTPILLDPLLSILHRVGAILQHVKLTVTAKSASSSSATSTRKLQPVLSKMNQALQHICVSFVEMLEEIKERGKSLSVAVFTHQVTKYFDADIHSLNGAAADVCQQIWLLAFSETADPSAESCHGHVLDWLDDQVDYDHRRQAGHQHGFSRDVNTCGEATPFVFDFVEPLVLKFFKTPMRLLVVTGEPGYGEQELTSNLLERLQLALPVDAKLLRGTFIPSRGSNRGTMRFLKSLLRQLLDQSIGNLSFVSAINEVSKFDKSGPGSDRLEDRLWDLLTEQCSKAGGNVAIVVDGMSQSDGADGGDQLLARLQELASKCSNMRCLALSSHSAAHALSGADIYTLSRAVISRNARLFLENAMTCSSTLSVLSPRIRREVLHHIADKQWSSLLEAKLILRLLESEKDVACMPDIIRETPKTFQGMLDHLLLKIDYKNPEIQTLLSWLLVGKRPVDILELEKNASVIVSNWLRRIQSGRAVSSNSNLSGVLTIRNGCLQFVDPLVKARMHSMSLHGKIPLTLHSAHLQVALDCLKRARDALSKLKVDLDFQHPASSKWAASASYSDFDPMVVYAMKHWHEHYEKSLTSSERLSGRVSAAIKALLPDSVLMVLAEWHFGRAESTDGASQEKDLLRLLTLRKAAFGATSPSVIQTKIILAHCSRSMSHLSDQVVDLGRLMEAFEGAVAIYGDPSPQATMGAKYIFSLIKTQTTIPPQGASVCRYLWGVHRRELGDSHDETLLVARALASLYKTEMRFAEAAEVLHDIYKASCRTRGLFAAKTLELFHLLIDSLEQGDRMSDAQQLCQDIFDAAPTLETWNETVLTAVLRIVHHCQDRGMSDVSKTKLRQLWLLLVGQCKKRNSAGSSTQAGLLASLTAISLRLAVQLRDLSHDTEASNLIEEYWDVANKFLTSDRQINAKMLVQLREMSQLLLRLDRHQSALEILRVLYDIHQSHAPRDHSADEMLIVYSALIACYNGVENPIEDFLWLNILDSILLAKERITAETVFVCRDLAILHRSRGDHATTISICRKTLTVLWPQIIGGKTGEMVIRLPESSAGECIEMVVLMAQMYKLTGDKERAAGLIDAVMGCCRLHILPLGPSSEAIATTLSSALEDAGLLLDALRFWKSLLGECRNTLGRSHRFTVRIATIIAQLNLRLGEHDDTDQGYDDDDNECEDHMCDVLDLEPDEDDLESITLLIEGLLALCKRHGSSGGKTKGPGKTAKGSDLLKRYERLWSYYFDLRHDLAIDAARGYDIFQGYCSTLITMKSLSVAIRLARKLRAAFLTDLGREDIWYLKVTLELTKLLEMDKATVREAAELYDDIKEICLGLSDPDEAFQELLRIAQERLAILVSTEPAMHDRAEQILLKTWKQAYEVHGYSHEQSMACCRKLIDFCVASRNMDARKRAGEVLNDAIIGVLSQERKPQRLFGTARSFVSMYQAMDFTYSEISLLKSIREKIFGSETTPIEGVCGQPYLAEKSKLQVPYDRRCLILIYSMESMFRGVHEAGLFEEVLTRVLTETALYEAWLYASRGSVDLDGLLNAATRLVEYLEHNHLGREAQRIETEAWRAFCLCLGKQVGQDEGSRRLFRTMIKACREQVLPLSLLESIHVTVQELASNGNHEACLLMSQWIHSKARKPIKSSDNSIAMVLFKLSTLLYTCTDTEASIQLRGSIEETATMLGVLAISYTADIDLSVISISHVSFILNIAGRQRDYKTLKRILDLLWTSRNSHDFRLSSATTIAIGKRLAEVHFVCGEHATAFGLLEDITYNLKDVYGVNHPDALSCQKLLASMHQRLGHSSSALDIRFSILRDALLDNDCNGEALEGQSDGYVALCIEELRSLRCNYASPVVATDDSEYACQHLEQNKESLEAMTAKLKNLVGDSAIGHGTADLLNLNRWDGLDGFGITDEVAESWSEPADWAVDMVMEEDGTECSSAWSVSDA